jgi:phosphoenolpyruvate carboxylase
MSREAAVGGSNAAKAANHVQIELLKRHRAGDADERVVQGMHLTINGIAAGLRNSG